MTLQHRAQSLLDALADYEREFNWIGLCLACGHAPPDTHRAMQRLHLACQAAGALDGLYPLLAAHWDVVNAAESVAAAGDTRERDARQMGMRRARHAHAGVLARVRQRWQLQPA